MLNSHSESRRATFMIARAFGRKLSPLMGFLLAIGVVTLCGAGRHYCVKCFVEVPKYIIYDKLETYVHVRYGCEPICSALDHRLPHHSRPDGHVDISLLAVYAERIDRAASSREILLDVVDSFGNPAEGPTVSQSQVITDECGRGPKGLKVSFNNTVGVFRVRVTYDDKKVRSFGYGPPIVVLSSPGDENKTRPESR